MSGGSAFQSLTVLGKKDILLFSVPQVIVWKALEWLCLVGLFCGVNLESLLMATSPLSILYIMQRRMSFLLFSRLRQFRVLNMSVTLEVLWCLWRIYLAALRWTISSFFMFSECKGPTHYWNTLPGGEQD